MESAKHEKRVSLPFNQVVRLQKSCHQLLPEPVAHDVILSVLADARPALANCNFQPWATHIVSGEKLRELAASIQKARDAGQFTPDYSFEVWAHYGRYGRHQQAYPERIGVAQDETAAGRAGLDLGSNFCESPHVALLFLPSFADRGWVADDITLYGQRFLFSLADHGLGGIPQLALGYYADPVRKVLGVSTELKLFFGISFGYADEVAPGHASKPGRDLLASKVFFHD